MAMDSQSMMEIPYKNQGIPIYRVCASGQTPHPAIILIHEVWGLTDHIKDVAGRFCEAGFEVIAPDLLAGTDVAKHAKPELQRVLFDPVERPKHQVEIRAMMTPLGAPDFAPTVIDKLQACFSYLKTEPSVTKIGVVGFCFGGTYSFGLAANQSELAAAVPFYGHGEHWLEDVSKINCPVMAFYGQRDESLNEHIPVIKQALAGAGKDFKYKIYKDAGHAFFNDTNPLTYNKPAADDAWKLTLEFLNQNLNQA